MFLLKSKRAVVLFYTNKNIFLLKELNLQVHLPVRCISIQVTNPFIFLSKSQASSCTAYTISFLKDISCYLLVEDFRIILRKIAEDSVL